ncbi:hypothetical protein MP638_003882 [Amoeboaphelidium occidentale]|nr:hypothetical protein MP638_003882 [Amoeboaphelidium occidentale]
MIVTVNTQQKEWRVISGAKSSKKQRDLWISKRDDIQTLNSGMPSAKVCTVQKFSQYLGVVLENHSRLFHFYGSLKWRQLRRKTDIRRQKAYDVLCKRIAGEKLDSIVAYGSAKFSASSRGSPPIPTTRLYKKLLQRKVCVRLVWEHRTSVVCSVCHNDLPKGKKWRVKICPTCKIYLNRDVNAAIAGEKLDSIVAYGSAKFSASSRGNPPIPTTRLYKKLLEKKVCVRLVWEHRTSVVCSVCRNDLPNGKKWRVKICPSCKIYWNRDVNAASNIRQIFLFMNGNNGQRPMQFKTFKQRMLASSASNPAIPNDGQ